MNSKTKSVLIVIVVMAIICLCSGGILMIVNKSSDSSVSNGDNSGSNTNKAYDGTKEIGSPIEVTINEIPYPETVGDMHSYQIGEDVWYYNLDSEGNAINIYANGNFTGDVILPSELDGHKVISIGKNLVDNKTTLFDTSIGGEHYWKNITSVTVPDGVKYINSGAFYGLDNLKKISLPDSIIYIGDNAFSYCSNLSSINSEIEGKIVMPKGLIYYGESLFRANKKINSFEFPDQINYIQAWTFYETAGFSDLVIGKQFMYICNNAFNSSSIKSLVIEDGVEMIDIGAFQMNKQLEKVIMADSVIRIGTDAFNLCVTLTDFKYDGKLTYIGKNVFDYTKVTDIIKNHQLPNS